jgi:hypothetical protein
VSVMCVGVRVLCVWEFLGAKKHRAGERILVSSIPVGQWRNVTEGSKCELSPVKSVHTQGTYGQFSGAMEEMSGKVQTASTH